MCSVAVYGKLSTWSGCARQQESEKQLARSLAKLEKVHDVYGVFVLSAAENQRGRFYARDILGHALARKNGDETGEKLLAFVQDAETNQTVKVAAEFAEKSIESRGQEL